MAAAKLRRRSIGSPHPIGNARDDLNVKALLDLFPVVVFFAAYYLTTDTEQRFFVATGATIIATILQVGLTYGLTRKVERMQLFSLGLMVVLGGLTLLLADKRFLMWKPTLVYWGFALAFLGSMFTRQSLVERMLGHALELPTPLWGRLNLAWALHFGILGGINLLVARYCSEATWVNFKLFGVIGLTLFFFLLQGLWLSRVGAAPRSESSVED